MAVLLVNETLHREGQGRMLNTTYCRGLFECLRIHVFKVEQAALMKVFGLFMRQDSQTVCFKSLLESFDIPGKTRRHSKGETENQFQKRLDNVYESFVNECCNVEPTNDFLHVYLFAIATMIGRPIFVLQENNIGKLVWSYFPFLYSHTFDEVRNEQGYTVNSFITLHVSTDYFYFIDSSLLHSIEPVTYGLIGIYQERVREVLLSSDIAESCQQKITESLQNKDVMETLERCLSIEMIRQCLDLSKVERSTLSYHRPNKSKFVNLLVNDDHLRSCLYEVLVRHPDGLDILQRIVSSEGFMEDGHDPHLPIHVAKDYFILSYTDFKPTQFRKQLQRLESVIIEMDQTVKTFVEKCHGTTEELTERRTVVNRSVIGGTVAGVVGGVMTIAGLTLAPATFGASMGLTVAGAALGGTGGVVGAAARTVEGVRQYQGIKVLKQYSLKIENLEKELISLAHNIEDKIQGNRTRCHAKSIEISGMDGRGFLAVGSAFRSMNGGAAIGVAAVRTGTVGAEFAGTVGVRIATKSLGPVSLLLDIGLLAEATYNLRTGSKTSAGEILDRNATLIQMKMNYFLGTFRGNILTSNRIVR